MPDIHCAVCEDPWDAAETRQPDGCMDADEARRFLAGEGCPSCGFGRKCLRCRGKGFLADYYCACRGTGELFHRNGHYWSVCEACAGHTCPTCKGTGRRPAESPSLEAQLTHLEEVYDAAQ